MSAPHRKPYAPGLRDEWRTPGEFVRGVECRWPIILDAAADAECTVAARYLDREADALACEWATAWKPAPGYERFVDSPGHVRDLRARPGNGAVWVNPPYSRIVEFVDACIEQSAALRCPVLLLGPASVGTAWWSVAFGAAREVWNVSARLRFDPPPGIEASSNTAGSTLFVFDGRPWSTGRICGLLDRSGRPITPLIPEWSE